MVYGAIIFEVETWELSLTPAPPSHPTRLMPHTVREEGHKLPGRWPMGAQAQLCGLSIQILCHNIWGGQLAISYFH